MSGTSVQFLIISVIIVVLSNSNEAIFAQIWMLAEIVALHVVNEQPHWFDSHLAPPSGSLGYLPISSFCAVANFALVGGRDPTVAIASGGQD